MTILNEDTEIMTGRKNMYAFLARIYKTEIDSLFLKQLDKTSFPEDGDENFIAGCRIIKNWADNRDDEAETNLAVDYARIFLAAGITKSDFAAYPYESVYTSDKRLIMQEARDKALAAYRSEGFDKASGQDIPEDHIYFELEFMALLCDKTENCLKTGNMSGATECIEKQYDFLKNHLLNWVPEFCADVEKYSAEPFYKGAAKITDSFLKMDMEMLNSYRQ